MTGRHAAPEPPRPPDGPTPVARAAAVVLAVLVITVLATVGLCRALVAPVELVQHPEPWVTQRTP